MPPPHWNASAAIERLPLVEWEGDVWRAHWRSIAPDDWQLSLETSGRFHRGRDLFPPGEVFPALYTSLEPHIAVWEMVRQRMSTNPLFLPNNRLSRLHMCLRLALDCSDLSVLGVEPVDIHGANRTIPWTIGASVVARGADALIVPSAALAGCNVIVFPTNLPRDWRVRIVSTQEMSIELPDELVSLLQDNPH